MKLRLTHSRTVIVEKFREDEAHHFPFNIAMSMIEEQIDSVKKRNGMGTDNRVLIPAWAITKQIKKILNTHGYEVNKVNTPSTEGYIIKWTI